MLNKEYIAMKEISKMKIDGKTYLRVVHHLGKLITNVTVFQLEKSIKDGELYLTELFIDEVSKDVQPKLMSDEYQVDIENDDKSLVIEVLKTKLLVIKDFSEKHINVGMKRKLMQFIEVGGHYIGFVYEEGMPYTKLYHINMDPVTNELFIGDVPPDLLPALFEALTPKLLKGASDLTIQVGEGVYARVTLVDAKTALVTVVIASEEGVGETKLSVFSGFTLAKVSEDEWVATIAKEEDTERIHEEMKKSFESIYQELLVKVFELRGSEALKGN